MKLTWSKQMHCGKQADVCSLNVISAYNDGRFVSRNELQVGDNIKLNLRDIVSETVDFIHLAQNRESFRDSVENGNDVSVYIINWQSHG
jgi:hypothetical protein